jgi:hypothetical protein
LRISWAVARVGAAHRSLTARTIRNHTRWSTVSTAPERVTHFAFGFAPSADYAPSRLPAALRMCLGF